jgi:hypothetical protein
MQQGNHPMRRRDFIAVLGGAVIAPRFAGVQSQGAPLRYNTTALLLTALLLTALLLTFCRFRPAGGGP